MTMAERRLVLTWSVSTTHPKSGQTPDISVRVIVRVSLGVCSDKVLSLIPSPSQIGEGKGSTLGTWLLEGPSSFCADASLQTFFTLLQEPMPWILGLTASRNSGPVRPVHILFLKWYWAHVSFSLCCLPPETSERFSWLSCKNWLGVL